MPVCRWCGQFEQPEERELKMILDGQNEIYRAIKLLLVKLDEVVGRQERELSMLTMISQAQPHAPAAADQRQVLIIRVTVLLWLEHANQCHCYLFCRQFSVDFVLTIDQLHFQTSRNVDIPLTSKGCILDCLRL